MSFAVQAKCLSLCPSEWVKGKVIGSGAYGTVRLAMNKPTGALFVVKSAQRQSGLGPESIRHEASILQSLDSPYIVKCLGRSSSSIVLEYMAGGSLADVAEKFGGVLDESVIRVYTWEILQGLKYLHENGIVHGDLKCKNVLLDSSGTVKLADLGCSRRVSGQRLRAAVGAPIGGTPLWMAPEVLRNEGLEFASDIWSLGCAVIEMATGKLPWEGEVSNPAAALLKIACSDQTPKFPTHFSKDGLDFLAKCLERDPNKRPASSELLDHPFVSRKKIPYSPAAVLSIAMYEEMMGGYESDESDSSFDDENDSELSGGNSFSSSSSSSSKRFQDGVGFGSDSVTSGNWITVRSG